MGKCRRQYKPLVKIEEMEERRYQIEIGLSCKAVIDGYTNLIFLNRYGMVHNPQTINRTIKRISKDYNELELDGLLTAKRWDRTGISQDL